MSFNLKSRTTNVINAFVLTAVSNIINVVLGLVYRSFFLRVLTAEYLGINGLFTNILAVMSIAELGITNSIMFRMYKPIKENDIKQIAQIIAFLKKAYRLIMISIFCFGIVLLPFLKLLISDASEIPADVNLYVVYLIFMFQTLSSYFFNYKQIILSADQRQYFLSVCTLLTNIARYAAQFGILWFTRNYVLTLLIGICVTVFSNFLISYYASRSYKEVMNYKGRISSELKKNVLNDVKATALHRIGGKIVTSTDSIIISKYVSLTAVGFYSNYSFIIVNLENIIAQALGAFVASIGNANVTLTKKDNYKIFKKLQYACLSVSLTTTVCLFVLTEPFIQLWVGSEMLLSKGVLIFLCLDYYFTISRQICLSFTNATGLFVKDKLRPVIQSVINLVVSIILVNRMGLVGVFIGTVISHLVTVFWREPRILFKDYFEISSKEYWQTYIFFVVLTIGDCCLVSYIVRNIVISVLGWILAGFIAVLISVITIILFTFNNEEFKFYFNCLIRIIVTAHSNWKNRLSK